MGFCENDVYNCRDVSETSLQRPEPRQRFHLCSQRPPQITHQPREGLHTGANKASHTLSLAKPRTENLQFSKRIVNIIHTSV